jgi:hypothetical protein
MDKRQDRSRGEGRLEWANVEWAGVEDATMGMKLDQRNAFELLYAYPPGSTPRLRFASGTCRFGITIKENPLGTHHYTSISNRGH